MPQLELDSSPNPSLPAGNPRGKAWLKGVVFLLISCVLFLIFMMYLQPDFVITTANQMWSCF